MYGKGGAWVSNRKVLCGRLDRKAGRRCPIVKWYVDVLIERLGVEKWIFGE